MTRVVRRMNQAVEVLVWIYAGVLLIWFALRAGLGDSLWWLAFLNTFAFYLFSPLLLLTPAAFLVRRRVALAGLVVPIILFLSLYGEQILPKSSAASAGHSRSLVVMTENVAGWTVEARPVLDLIRAEQPDLVFLQELNLIDSAGLEQELGDAYPYQALRPIEGTSGLGVLSKLPFRDLGWVPLGDKAHAAQRLELQVQDHMIEILNVHLEATAPANKEQTPSQITRTYQDRAQQARELVALGESLTLPSMVAGDLNTTDTTRTYAILRQKWTDSQREAGWGFDLSYPAVPLTFGPAQIRTPLIRIDYILHTPEFAASDAYTAWDGQSDHRAFFVTLRLK